MYGNFFTFSFFFSDFLRKQWELHLNYNWGLSLFLILFQITGNTKSTTDVNSIRKNHKTIFSLRYFFGIEQGFFYFLQLYKRIILLEISFNTFTLNQHELIIELIYYHCYHKNINFVNCFYHKVRENQDKREKYYFVRLFLSDDRTQHWNKRGARAFNFASFHSTMSVGVLMALNIYEFTVLLRAQFESHKRRELCDSLSNFS